MAQEGTKQAFYGRMSSTDSQNKSSVGCFADMKYADITDLIRVCVNAIDDRGVVVLADNNLLVADVFMMHQWYLSSCQLAEHLHEFYLHISCKEHSPLPQARSPIGCSSNATTSAYETHDPYEPSLSQPLSNRQCADCFSLRKRTCCLVQYWMHNFCRHFDSNYTLKERILSLQKQVTDWDGEQMGEMLDTSALPTYAWVRNVSVRNHIVRQQSLSFDQWTPKEIANCLTHIDFRAVARITFSEYKQYAVSSNIRTTPILERSISMFNSLSYWVQCMVLNKSTPRERADVMNKFINVGTNLVKLQNYNTLMAVVGGLTHSAIARLTKTYACIPTELRQELQRLSEVLNHSSNFAAYRKCLSTAKSSVIPIIGVHLKDLIAVQNAHEDKNAKQQINCRKLHQLASIFRLILLNTDCANELPECNLDLINTIKVSLDLRYKEDEIYELSLKREPRTLLAFQAKTKSDVFAEWAAGVNAALDAETIGRHVAAMVDAVFEHYDNDKDGYISQAEFETIAGNFPFIDPFSLLDSDRDGRISRDEMCKYFVQMNQKSAEFRRGFRHNFYETTFLAPTTCMHCNKLLWGILRQGYKCKDCAIAVHKACKDYVVAECRADPDKAGSSGLPSSKNSAASGSDNSPRDDKKESKSSSHFSQPRRRMFLNISLRTKSRLRTVSTGTAQQHGTSTSPSPDPTPSTAPTTLATHGHAPDFGHGRAHRWFNRSTRRKARAQSDTDDRHDSPDCVDTLLVLPSLASEEVFEEEQTTSSNTKDE